MFIIKRRLLLIGPACRDMDSQQIQRLQIIQYHHIVSMMIMALVYKYRRRLTWRHRRFQSRAWLLKRREYGAFHNLFQELMVGQPDTTDFYKFIRMDPDVFNEISDRLVPRLRRRSTRALVPGHRLTIALRFYATGDAYMDLGFSFYTAHNINIIDSM